MTENTELDVLKNNVVTSMFVDTADENYLMARLAYHSGLYQDFFWNAAQATEKYLKASLLLNGETLVKNNGHNKFGHSLVRLFRKVETYGADFFPGNLTKPSQLSDIHWKSETPRAFIERLNAAGDPSARYNVYGYTKRWEDLCHLDQFLWFARRLAFRLDTVIAPKALRSNPNVPQTVADRLQRDLTYSPRTLSSRLGKLTGPRSRDELRHGFFKGNFPFAPADYDHGPMLHGSASSNPVLYRRIFSHIPNEGTAAANPTVADLAEWAASNIFFGPAVSEQLREAARCLRS